LSWHGLELIGHLLAWFLNVLDVSY